MATGHRSDATAVLGNRINAARLGLAMRIRLILPGQPAFARALRAPFCCARPAWRRCCGCGLGWCRWTPLRGRRFPGRSARAPSLGTPRSRERTGPRRATSSQASFHLPGCLVAPMPEASSAESAPPSSTGSNMLLICFSEKTNSTSMSTATPIRAMVTFITLSEMCDAWYAIANRLATIVPLYLPPFPRRMRTASASSAATGRVHDAANENRYSAPVPGLSGCAGEQWKRAPGDKRALGRKGRSWPTTIRRRRNRKNAIS